MRGKADFGALWNVREFFRGACCQKSTYKPGYLISCPTYETISESSCFVVQRWRWLVLMACIVACMMTNEQKSSPGLVSKRSSHMDVPAAPALQVDEGFLRASCADIKVLLAWRTLTGVVCVLVWEAHASLLSVLRELSRHSATTNFFALKFFWSEWIPIQTK